MNFFTELSNRWGKDSPAFFKKLQSFGGWLSGASTSILLIPGIPDALKTIAGYALTAGAVILAVSKLPVKNPDYQTLDKPIDEPSNPN